MILGEYILFMFRLTVSYLRTRDLVSTDGIKPKVIKECFYFEQR